MDQVFWIAAALTIIIVSVAAGHTAYKEFLQKSSVNKLYADFMGLIENEYKSRLSGSNRFLVNQDVLKMLYPDASADDIEGLFRKLVDAKIIDRDPIDQAWSLR